jgi:hypothetical protein
MRFWDKSRVALFSLVFAIAGTITFAKPQSAEPSTKRTVPQRANELTLASLRPGRDTLAKATRLYGKPNSPNPKSSSASSGWEFSTGVSSYIYVVVDTNREGKILTIRLEGGESDGIGNPHYPKIPTRFATGLGVGVGDESSKLTKLYGEPESRSPSSKGGQQLELWYYAFDWAGADVPQVMEVLCTKEKDGKPGRVIEITLAAPSL